MKSSPVRSLGGEREEKALGGPVDLRSDTVTQPTEAMRRAMAAAEVGDDGYGEDPTVNALEELYAARVGKSAALFVPSGTMANQIAVRVLAEPGSLVIAGRRQHIVAYELGAAAYNAGIQFHLVDDPDGIVLPDDISWCRQAASHHQPPPSLVCIENTHMAASGAVWSIEALKAVVDTSDGLPIHMDGARLFNAEIASGIVASELAAGATTVMTCLSKGLCAPVGSLLAGSDAVIEQGRDERKRLGGGMRQAGVLAAAGIVALERMVERLGEDHRRARLLADAVAERWPEAGVDPEGTVTNLVVFSPPDPDAALSHFAKHEIRVGTIAPGVVRLVTHHDIDDDDIERARRVVADAP